MTLFKSYPWLLSSTRIFQKLHILNYPTFPVIAKLMFYALLLYETIPVQLGLSHGIDFPRSVINGAHDVVEVVVGYSCFFQLEILLVLFGLEALDLGELRLDFLSDFQLTGLFVHYELLACKNNTPVRLHAGAVQYARGDLEARGLLYNILVLSILVRFYSFETACMLLLKLGPQVSNRSANIPNLPLLLMFQPIKLFLFLSGVVILILLRVITFKIFLEHLIQPNIIYNTFFKLKT